MNFNGKINVSVDLEYRILTEKIVQLYKRFGWICHQTFKRVKGFQKIALKRRKTVTFEISIEDLKFYNSDLNLLLSLDNLKFI
jgi:beta-glucosidase